MNRLFNGDVKKQSQLGPESTRCKLNHFIDEILVKTAARSLICESRIGIPVGDHDPALFERWFDQQFDMLGTVGGEKEQLRDRGDNLFGLQECLAKSSSQRSAARLLCRNDFDILLTQLRGQKAELR